MPESGSVRIAGREELLRTLGTRYLWWERERIDAIAPRRIVAQIMDIGTYEDIEAAIDTIGRTAFIDALANALPGWFRPRSWSYWHLRLGLRQPGESSPPMPSRTFA